jgi:UDP-N-acetylmuramoylalanine--D-glutamate ligase
MHQLKDLHVLILGLGASGLAMARWCARCGAQVTVADTREAPANLEALRNDVPAAQFVSGAFDAAWLEGSTLRGVFTSPGLAPEAIAPVMDAAKAQGLWTGGELSLFSQALADLAVPPVPLLTVRTELVEVPEPTALRETALSTGSGKASTSSARKEFSGELPLTEDSCGLTEAPLPDDDEPLPAVVIAPPAAPKGYEPKVLAITGTNGKTTVTSLTGQLVERAGKRVAVAGNIGPTLLDTLAARLDALKESDEPLPEVWVIELSSFQLNDVMNFEPTAATVLNLTQDHLDWHGSMQAYAAAKARIFGEKTLMVLNREDPLVMAMLPAPIRVKGGKMVQRPCVTFGADMPQRPGDYGIEVVSGMAWLVRAIEADETQKKERRPRDAEVLEEEIFLQRLMPADALRIRGRHNAVNALASLALAQIAGCALGPMLYGLREYRGEPHRVEPVGAINSIEYFDDSKGTNVGATVAALYGLGAERRVVVILGGDGKGQDFSPLAAPVSRHARAVVLIGRDAPKIRAALADAGVPMMDAATMEEAVDVATQRAHAGDAVLMSPACASFDMFRNYPHRAEVFVAAVRALAERHGMLMEGTQ